MVTGATAPSFCCTATFPPIAAVSFPVAPAFSPPPPLIGATLAVAPADGLRSLDVTPADEAAGFSFSSSDSEEFTGEKMLFFLALVAGADRAGLGPFFAIGGVILGGSFAPVDLAAPFVIGADFGWV